MKLPVADKINISKLKNRAKKIPEILAEKAFVCLIIIVLLNVLIGAFIFYQYDWQIRKRQVELTDKTLVLKQDILKKIILQLDQAQEQLKQTESKIYPDLFKPGEHKLTE